MTTAKTYAKANRYLLERRVAVVTHTPSTIDALVAGDHGMYAVHGDDNGWTCMCPAHGTCSHIIAVEALTQQWSPT